SALAGSGSKKEGKTATTATAAEHEEDKPVKRGIASWYGGDFHGKKTANGERYDMQALTCATNHFALGTWLRITSVRNGKSVVVKVNDRMHPRMKRIVDLSRKAAQIVGIERSGTGEVLVEDLGKNYVAAR
ncbi:MAG TPA: septal ring lytic transglycosylase RlpA family protein, partial [Phnomibacter sp.]|nr:septal ring lytic transglycosylase RlpA family protein [Phnomibacter sp.]